MAKLNGNARFVATLIAVILVTAAGVGAHFSALAAIDRNTRDITTLQQIDARVRKVEFLLVKMATKQGVEVTP